MDYIRVHVIPTANDDGSKYIENLTKDHIRDSLDYANHVYKDANIFFVLDGFDPIRRSTLLNQDQLEVPKHDSLNALEKDNPNKEDEENPCKAEKINVSKEYPGKLVVFYGKGYQYYWDEHSMFNWNKVPGDDEHRLRLINFLTEKFSYLDWIKNANIEKRENEIELWTYDPDQPYGKRSLRFHLYGSSEVWVYDGYFSLPDGFKIIDRFYVKVDNQNNELNVYQKNWIFEPGHNDYSSANDDYVRMVGAGSISSLAHEIGHYLHIRHTFGDQPTWLQDKDVPSGSKDKSAETIIREYVDGGKHPKENGLDVFDGDRDDHWYNDKPEPTFLLEPAVADTPPDPGSAILMYAFCWEDIPGKDDGRLKEFLIRRFEERFDIDWIKDSHAEKTNNGKTIKISTGNNALYLKLNDKDEVILEINNTETEKFKATTKDGKINIYANINPCSKDNKLTITVNLKDEKNRVYELVPDLNILSYYGACDGKYHHISRGQRDIIRDALDTGNRRHLAALSGLGVLSRNSHQLEVFYIGQDQALWHRWSEDSGANWSKAEPLGGILTSAPAAISIKSDQLDIFYRGLNGHLYNKRNKAYQWLEDKDIGGDLASAPAVLSPNSDQLDVFYRGVDHRLWHIWSEDSGDNWSKAEPLGGRLTSAPAAISIKPDQLDIFYRGRNGHLYYKRNKEDEKDLGGVLNSAPVVLSRNSHQLEVFYCGQDQALWHRWSEDSGDNWSEAEPLGGILTSSLAAISIKFDQLDIFYVGLNGRLYNKRNKAYVWLNQIDMGSIIDPKRITSGLGILSRNSHQLEVFFVGQDQALWHRWSNDSGVNWSKAEPLGGKLISSPVAISINRNQLDVFYVGQNGHLYNKRRTLQNWLDEEDMGGVLTSAPAVLSRNSHQLEVFYRGEDQALWHRWSDDSGANWSIAESLGGILTSAPAAISIKPDQLDIFYRGLNGQLYNKRNKAYAWVDEKDMGGNLASAPAVLSRNSHQLEVFYRGAGLYRGADQALWHIWSDDSGDNWSNAEPLGGKLTSAPAAISIKPEQLDIFYVGQNGHLYNKRNILGIDNVRRWKKDIDMGGDIINTGTPL